MSDGHVTGGPRKAALGCGDTQPTTPLGRARWGLDRVATLVSLCDDEMLQYRALGLSVGEMQRTTLAYAQAHALVSIAESLRIIAGKHDDR